MTFDTAVSQCLCLSQFVLPWNLHYSTYISLSRTQDLLSFYHPSASQLSHSNSGKFPWTSIFVLLKCGICIFGLRFIPLIYYLFYQYLFNLFNTEPKILFPWARNTQGKPPKFSEVHWMIETWAITPLVSIVICS